MRAETSIRPSASDVPGFERSLAGRCRPAFADAPDKNRAALASVTQFANDLIDALDGHGPVAPDDGPKS